MAGRPADHHQAAVLFWLVAIAPFVLIAGVAIANDPASALILVALLVFVLIPMTTLMVVVVDYMGTHGVKQRMQADRADQQSRRGGHFE